MNIETITIQRMLFDNDNTMTMKLCDTLKSPISLVVVKSIKNDDEISYKLNKEIIMIPSSPNITYEEQKKVVDTIYKFTYHI